MSDKFCVKHKENRRAAHCEPSTTDCPYCEIERLKEIIRNEYPKDQWVDYGVED